MRLNDLTLRLCFLLFVFLMKKLFAASVIFMLNVFGCTRRLVPVMAGNSTSNNAGTFSIAYVTAPNEDVAKKLAKGLVQQKLAGCVNIIPSVLSIYEWQNELQTDSEVLMMIKTRTSIVEELTKYVRENHPYEVCECISTPIQHGNPPYLKWLEDLLPVKETCH